MMTANHDLARLRQIVLQGLGGIPASVYLFGSQAKGKGRRASDIDVAVLPRQPLPEGLLSEIRQKVEESDILPVVDLVDLSTADPAFRQRVLKEGVLWNG